VCNLLNLLWSTLGLLFKNISSFNFLIKTGSSLAKLITHFLPHSRTSSPEISYELIPDEGDVADETITLLMPVR